MGANHETVTRIREFVRERDWARFHTPAGLAKSISIEAAELLEHFQWDESRTVKDVTVDAEVRDELADVLTYCLLFADYMSWDVDEIVQAKLEKSAVKHRAEGSATPASRRRSDRQPRQRVQNGAES